MSSKLAIQNILKDTLVGTLVGWGAFAAFIPNMLSSISEVNELGSFFSLRLFSMVFFLLPLFVFTTYWWVRGVKLFTNYAKPFKTDEKYYTIITLFFIGLKLALPILFAANEFFLYSSSLGNFNAHYILWYYLFIATAELIYFVLFYCIKIKENSNAAIFIIACGLVFSIDIVLGLGMMAFIEPWIIYNKDTQFQVVAAGTFYLIPLLFLYLQYGGKSRKLSTFKLLAIVFLVLIFMLSSFPVLAWNSHIPINAIGATTIVLIVVLLFNAGHIAYQAIKKKKKNGVINFLEQIKIPYSLLFGILLVAIFLCVAQKYFFNKALLKANMAYFDQRLEASKNISDSKVFPLIFFNKTATLSSSKNSLIICLDSKPIRVPLNFSSQYDKHNSESDITLYARFSALNTVAKNNHAFANFKNGRSSSFILETQAWNGVSATPQFEKLQDSFNVKKKYFKGYLDTTLVKSITHSTSSEYDTIHSVLASFYSETYKYIEEGIIIKYLIPVIKHNPPILLDYKEYFHPINYYTATLKHYKDESENIVQLKKLLQELGIKDSIMAIDPLHILPINYKQKTSNSILKQFEKLSYSTFPLHEVIKLNVEIDSLFSNPSKNKLRLIEKIKTLSNKIYKHTNAHNFKELCQEAEKLSIIFDKKDTTSIVKGEKEVYKALQKIDSLIIITHAPTVPFFESLKSLQYIERYKRAQIIFSGYLADSQRIGLYVLVFSFISLLLLYWVHLKIPRDDWGVERTQDGSSKPFDELPGGFLNISIAIILVLTLHVARPIKAEHINPEKPYWMMDLDNWYEPTRVESILGKEDKVNKVINYYKGVESKPADLSEILKALKEGNTNIVKELDSIKKKF